MGALFFPLTHTFRQLRPHQYAAASGKRLMVGTRYTRGRVNVLDRNRLEATACECYGVVNAYSLRSGL
jgi:hypothetical protein